MSIPILDLSLASNLSTRQDLLSQLYSATFDVGFLYIKNHSVPQSTITTLTDFLPALFNLPEASKAKLSKLNSPHFVGYNGFGEETTLGKNDMREQFDFATELKEVWNESGKEEVDGLENGGRDEVGKDFSRLFWRLRGGNLWPEEEELPGFREALTQ
jgi:isopenicillin N synthase-like dioxygenase